MFAPASLLVYLGYFLLFSIVGWPEDTSGERSS